MSGHVIRGGSWSVIGSVVVLLVSLVATPFVIRLLGPHYYGLFVLLNTLIAYVTFVDLGMGVASSKFGATALAKGDARGEASVVWTAVLISAVPSGLITIVLFVWAPDIVAFLNLAPGEAQAALALRIAAVGFLARTLSGVLNTPQVVRMRWDLNVAITAGSAVLQLVLVPIVLWLGAGLVGAITASTIVAILGAALHLLVSARLQPKMWPPTLNLPSVRPLVSFGTSIFLGYLTMVLLLNVDRIILARMESVTQVGFYSVAAAAAAVLNIIPYAIDRPLFPAFAHLVARNDREQLRALGSQLLRLIYFAMTPCVVVAFAFARPFFSVWAGELYAQESTFPFYLLLIGVAFNALGTVPETVLTSTDRPGLVVRYHALEVAPYIALAILLIGLWGPVGAAVAWSARCIVNTGLYFWGARDVIRRDRQARPALARHALALGFAVGPTVLALLLSLPLAATAAMTAVGLGLYGVVVWRLLLSPTERGVIARVRSSMLSTLGFKKSERRPGSPVGT